MRAGSCVRFNGRIRAELLNESLFFGVAHARTKIAVWIKDYNQRRPPPIRPVCAERPITRRRDDATQGTSSALQRHAEAMGITS